MSSYITLKDQGNVSSHLMCVNYASLKLLRALLVAQLIKESAFNAGDLGLVSRLARSPGERNGNPLRYSLSPGESHGQRGLAGYSPWGHKSQTRLSD